MALVLVRATRKPFYVNATRVTEANIREVSEWCGGMIRPTSPTQYIHVPVEAAKSERQTRAYVGDWVLKAKTGFKVYTHKAYLSSFDELSDLPCANAFGCVTRLGESK